MLLTNEDSSEESAESEDSEEPVMLNNGMNSDLYLDKYQDKDLFEKLVKVT